MDMRLEDNFRTCNTLFRDNESDTYTIPWPATVIRDPSIIVIFLFPRHGLYVLNLIGLYVIWLVALKSMTQEPREDILEALKA